MFGAACSFSLLHFLDYKYENRFFKEIAGHWHLHLSQEAEPTPARLWRPEQVFLAQTMTSAKWFLWFNLTRA